jgi:hypothetical protein
VLFRHAAGPTVAVVSRSTREGGQASIEYVAVVALVALALGGASFAAAGPPVAAAVMEGLRRGLCLIAGGSCSTRPTPCVVASATTDERAGLDIAVFRVGRRAGILRQERSDGTIAITEIEDLEGGLRVGIGAHGRVRFGGVRVGLGGQLQAALLAELGHGRTFVVRSREAADRLIARLVYGSPATMLVDLPIRVARGVLGMGRGGIPEPDEVYFEGGARGLLGAGLVSLPGSLELAAAAGITVGGRWDRRTGRRTLYFRLTERAAAPLTTVLGSVGEEGERTLVGGIAFDRRGRPVEFSLSGAARLTAGASSPAVALLRRAGADLAVSGSRYEFDARLNLGNPANAAAVRMFLLALAVGGGTGKAGRELAERIERDAQLDARAYEVRGSELGIDGAVALGPRLGGNFSFERTAARLVAAVSRPPHGWWDRRTDCVPG